MNKPLSRKQLEALVKSAYGKWLDGTDNVGVVKVITDALWERMVVTHRDAATADDEEMTEGAGYSRSNVGPVRRLLICTDDPAPTVEADAVKLARWVKRMTGDAGWGIPTVRVAIDAADRILKEADNGD